MNYYKDFENLELPTYQIKNKKPIKACFEQPFANNKKYPYEETKTMIYINKEELIEQLKKEIQNIWRLSREAGASVSYDWTKSKVELVYEIIEMVNSMPITEDIKLIDSNNEELIEAQDKAFDKFSKTDMYKAILGMSIAKTNEDLAANNNLNKWLEEDIDE